MSKVVPFQFDRYSIRVVDIVGEPWFNASEVCEILGFANPWDAVQRHVDVDDLGKYEVIDSKGRTQLANHVNESGLYALIFGSTKQEAKKFKRWVTSEVLPAIRNTGTYALPGKRPVDTTTEALKLTPLAVKAARAFGLDKNAAAISANQLVRKLTGVNLLEDFGHTHLVAANQDARYFTPTELGKRIGVSARKLNQLLSEAGLQLKRGDVWEVMDSGKDFSRIFDTGKRHGNGVPIQQIKWAASVLPLLKPAAEAA